MTSANTCKTHRLRVSLIALWGLTACVYLSGLPDRARSQVIPDNTLAQPSRVSQTGATFTITGGTSRGGTLFHSFQALSVPTNGTAWFDNAASIQTIIARVTGNQPSTIDGLLRTNPSAHLFLLNPHGIVFGRNAQLQVGGSFMASTVNTLQFPDGSTFSASQPQDAPLLSVTLQPGLQYGVGRPQAPIGQLGRLTSNQSLGFQASRLDLQGTIQAGGWLTLQASDGLQMRGATVAGGAGTDLTAPTVSLSNSRIISQAGPASRQPGGAIRLTADRLNLQDNSLIVTRTAGSSPAGDIMLRVRDRTTLTGGSQIVSLVEPTAPGQGGDIHLTGGTLRVANGAAIATIAHGQGNGGAVHLNLQTIQIDGNVPPLQSMILTQLGPYSTGNGGDVHIRAATLQLTNGGWLASLNAGQGQAGQLDIQARQSVHLDGLTAIRDDFGQFLPTGIFSYTANEAVPSYGRGGDISVNTPMFLATRGGSLQSITRSFGDGGHIQINSRTVNLSGTSSIVSNTDRTARAGNIVITASDRFTLQGVGVAEPAYDSLALAIVNGTLMFSPLPNIASLPLSDLWQQQGVTIENAQGEQRFLSVTDVVIGSRQRTSMFSAAASLGQAGGIQITSPQIDITDQVVIGVIASSPRAGTLRLQGNTIRISDSLLLSMPLPGQNPANPRPFTQNNLEIVADRLTLDHSYLIAAASGTLASGFNLSAGNISLTVRDLLLLRHGSQISARAFGRANGGNLTIDAGLIAAVAEENSDLVASAFRGNGGTIRLTTEGVFGLAYRPQLTAFSDINASSAFGIDGSFILRSPNLDPSQGLVTLSTEFVEPTDRILQTCSPRMQRDRFIVTGRGGLPPSPMEMLNLPAPWTDHRSVIITTAPPPLSRSEAEPPPETSSVDAPASDSPEIIEATTWIKAADGSIHLVATHPGTYPVLPTVCHVDSP